MTKAAIKAIYARAAIILSNLAKRRGCLVWEGLKCYKLVKSVD